MTLFGPRRLDDGVEFRLWAPDAPDAHLILPDRAPVRMRPAADGFFTATLNDVRSEQRYRFHLRGLDVPDPASRQQHGDPLGWSVLREALPPPRQPVPPCPWHRVVLAELHVGTVTPEGRFDALAERLDHFVAAGFTAIQLMPVADFPGRHNWGYDGVLPFAPDERYGTPASLRRLVDAAHGRGLGIMLDVVHNHFGPEGSFLSHYAGPFFTDAHHTPWGAAINLEHPLVRRYFIESAVMWLTDYDLDGLRFDAVHAFVPAGGDIFLRELAEACRAVKPEAWLVLENDHNGARWLERDETGIAPLFTAQWNDDAHHALHVAATGETFGYYADYAADPPAAVQRALAEGFVYQGDASSHRGGATRGEPSSHLPPSAFVNFVQNHDQIGNRPRGDRLAGQIDPARLALLRFMLLLGPAIPMFFQGEEAAVTTPFPYFCDFGGELGEAVREGRRREFRDAFDTQGEVPDPLDPATMMSAILPWDAMTPAATRKFRELVEHRERLVMPLLATPFLGAQTTRNGAALAWQWRFAAGSLGLFANLDAVPVDLDAAPSSNAVTIGEVIFDGSAVRLDPWSGCAWTEPA